MDSPLILCNDNSKSPNKEGSASAYSKEVGYVSKREKEEEEEEVEGEGVEDEEEEEEGEKRKEKEKREEIKREIGRAHV